MTRGVWVCEHCDTTIQGEDRVVEAKLEATQEPGGALVDGEVAYFLEAHWTSDPQPSWRELDRGRLSELV